MKKIYNIIILCVCFISTYGQSDDINYHYGESFLLENIIPADQTHFYNASKNVTMCDGFRTVPDQNNYFHAKTDPMMVIPPELNTTIGPPNNNNGGIPGTIVGNFSVSPTGAASYNVPLQLPSGINGMTPELTLNYSSQGGDGIMGDGWSLGGISVISRVPYTYYYNDDAQTVTFNDNDQLSLNGSHLIKINDTEIEYRTENESYSKIVPYDGSIINNGFIVYDKNGKVFYYGITANSRQVLQTCSSPIAWYLEKVVDPSGNYINFNYINDPGNGFVCLDYIQYTGNSNTDTNPFYKINLTYEDRTDAAKLYFYHDNNSTYAGLFSRLMKRLKKIECFYTTPQNQLITEYRLNYSQKGLFSEYFLTDITQYEPSGYHFNPTLINWTNKDYYPNSQLSHLFNESFDENSQFYTSDFNQDGDADIIHLRKDPSTSISSFYIHMNNNNGYFNKIADFSYEFYSILSFYTGDFNGDGINDIFYTASAGGNVKGYVIYITYDEITNIITAETVNTSINLPPTFTNPRFYISDFSGDGLMDCCAIYGQTTLGQCMFYLSNEDEPLHTIVSNASLYFDNEKIYIGDFDGDFKSELLAIGSVQAKIVQLISNNSNVSKSPAPDEFCEINSKLVVGDFNSDGKADVLQFLNSSENNWKFYHSYGKGFISEDILSLDNLAGNNRIFAVDLNGDSRTDISLFKIEYDKNSKSTNLIRIDYLMQPNGKSFLQLDPIYIFDYLGNINLSNCLFLWDEFDNSGYLDMFFIYLVGTNWYKVISDAVNFNCNAIDKITNGFGKAISIDYIPLMNYSGYLKGSQESYPIYNLTGNMNVVSGFYIDNGMGTVNQTDFIYKGAKYHRIGKGYLGFDEFTTLDYLTGIKKTMYFSHENDYYNVQLDKVELRLIQNANLIKRQINSHFYIDLTNTRFITYLDESTTEEFEINGALSDYYKETNTYTYDANDIPVTFTNEVKNEFNSTWVKKNTVTQFLNITDNEKWILGLPQSISTQHTSNDAPMIERYTTKEYFPLTGYLKKTTIEPGNTLKSYWTSYTYDPYGNVAQTTFEANGMELRTTNNYYTSSGRFLDYSTNALDQSVQYQYYENTGSLKKIIDPNGLETTYYYDGFGRNYKTVDPYGLVAENTLRWSEGNANAPLNSLYYSWSQSSGTPPQIIFFDKLGRELRSVSIGFNGEEIFSDQEYFQNSFISGLIKRTSKPYFKNDTPLWIDYTYDMKRRKSTITFPDYRVESFAYSPKQMTTTINAGGVTRQTRQSFDAASRLISSTDLTNNQTVNYTYYSNGLQKSTKISGNNATEILTIYDIIGNVESVNDPDLGLRSYTYYPTGELHTETDANGKTISYSYDKLGRTIERIEFEGTTEWQYDTQEHGIGKVATILYDFTGYNAIMSSMTSEFYYDSKSRLIKEVQSIDDEDFEVSYTYDILNRQKELTYPSGYKINNRYNERGFLGRIMHENSIIWEADVYNAAGQLKEYSLGTAINCNLIYQPENDRLIDIQSGKNTSVDLQNFHYTYYDIGNLKTRKDQNNNLTEEFIYDNFDRLTDIKLNNVLQMHLGYNSLGNIESKTDAGNYLYGENDNGIHAVTSISGNPATISDIDQSIHYTSFEKIDQITENPNQLNMVYNHARQRIRQTITDGSGNPTIKTYLGGLYEKIETNTSVKELNYISSPAGVIAIVCSENNSETLNYILKDNLGSIHEVLDENGNILEELSFDAWGRRRNASNWTFSPSVPSTFIFDRGFTGHEHLDMFALINMNGRAYDPVLGRFLSPDPIIQNAANSQNLNRYSYVLNNPLKYVDPSGYVLDKVFDLLFSPVDAVSPFLYAISTSLTVPARLFANISYGPPGGGTGFDLQYILLDKHPDPPAGVIDPQNHLAYDGSRIGYVSTDGTYFTYDQMAEESWALYAKNHQAVEQGDFNNIDINEVYALIGFNRSAMTTGLDYRTDDPPKKQQKEGEKTKEEVANYEWGTMYIITNVSSDADLTDGHAWIRIENKKGEITTMSLWGNRGEQEFWLNLEINGGYGLINKSNSITAQQYNLILEYNSNPSNINWTPWNTCAGYSAGLWNYVTGDNLSATDYFWFTSPRSLAGSINENP